MKRTLDDAESPPNKEARVTCTTTEPSNDVWTHIWTFCDDIKTFRSLFMLTKELHGYNGWKNVLAHKSIRVDHTKLNWQSDLSYAHKVNAKHSKITDHELIYLKGIHTLGLSYCYRITNQGLKHLKRVHTLNLSWCHKITDK